MSGGDILLVAEPQLSVDDTTLATTFAVEGRSVRVVRVTATAAQERAAAQAAVETARAKCKDGRALAFQVMTDAAIATLESATARFAESATSREDFSAMATCLIELGAVLYDAGRDGADTAFARALAMDPAASPDTRRHNPMVVERFESVRAELAKQGLASLELTTSPTRAAVTLDGVPLGDAPLSRSGLTPGSHILSISATGHHRFVEELRLDAKTTTQRSVRLSPIDEPFAALPRDDDAAERLAAFAAKHGAGGVIVLDTSGTSARAWSAEQGTSPLLRGTDLTVVAQAVRTFLRGTETSPELSPFVAALPLGIGHFAQDRPVAGAIFLATELGLIAVNVFSAHAVLTDRQADGTFKNAERNRQLQILNLTAFALLVVEMAGEGWHGVTRAR